MKRRHDPNQALIDWDSPPASAATSAASAQAPAKPPEEGSPPLAQRLPWDFKSTFPQPTDEALDTGVIDANDCLPDNLRSLHEDYAQQCLAVLRRLDGVLDARRRGTDPTTGKAPETHAAKERLRQHFGHEPQRLEHVYRVLIETYESAFGPEAAQAFSKAIRARHAGIDVVADGVAKPQTPLRERPAPPRTRRVVAMLPVPRPLAAAIAAGDFGRKENGRPVKPSPVEVRALTEAHAEQIIELLERLKTAERSRGSLPRRDQTRAHAECDRLGNEVQAALQKYASSFGLEAAERLEAYARRQQNMNAAGIHR